MKEFWTKLGEAIRHNQAVVVAIIIAVFAVTSVYGMQSKVPSIKNPDLKVTRAELEIEVTSEQARLQSELNNLIAIAKMKGEQLDKQDAIKNQLVSLGMTVATGGGVEPLAVLNGVLSILVTGLVISNRQKDGIIAGKQMEQKPAA